MTTQYIDPQVIFASDAPAQDKPPAFNNYAKGMDETRSNDGRPTIKQFNFIQQQNDFKFLYIHERGACLPFVEGFPYENNAIVFKDGFIQQKNGSSWLIPFMRGSQNLAELTDVAQARIKLDVYSKGEALSKENNLLDVSDKGVARTNLGVYSKAETDAIAGTPNATETVAGKARLATQAEAQAGISSNTIITPSSLRQALNATGDAPIVGLRAWVCFDGITTVSNLNGVNILSVVRNGTSDYTINFSTPMPNANYALLTMPTNTNDGAPLIPTLHMTSGNPTLKTVNSVRILVKATTTAGIIESKSVMIGVVC